MNKFKEFIGIDVSKEVFDVALLKEREKPIHQVFENSLSGCKLFLKWLKGHHVDAKKCLICAEHTGMYTNNIVVFAAENSLPLWLEMSYRIIRSSGIQRGKTDKVDALRIAQYALRHHDHAELYIPKDRTLIKLSALLGLRDKLVRTKASLLRAASEYKAFDKEITKLLTTGHSKSIKAIEKDIAAIDRQSNELIREDQRVYKVYKQVSSVSGVGRITALALICYTNGFDHFSNPKKLACYCGVVPFEYTSGKSVKGKPRVHHMANKKLKQLLHMCALTASKNDPELRDYFLRKVAEGKPKMLVINNIRNKIIHRICACVNEDRLYLPRVAA